MSYMDDIKNKTGDMSDLKARYEQLKSKETTGDLDDKGREELQKLKAHFSKEES